MRNTERQVKIDGHRYGRMEGVEEHRPGVEPHALANELTDEQRVQARGDHARSAARPSIESDRSRDHAVTGTEKSILRWMGGLIALLVVLGLLTAAAVTRNWYLLGIAAIAFIPFMILLLAPVWLASTTKISQDRAAAGESRSDGSDAMQRPPER